MQLYLNMWSCGFPLSERAIFLKLYFHMRLRIQEFFAKFHLAVCLPPAPWQQLYGAAWKIPSSTISLQYRQENMEVLPQVSSQYLPNAFPEGEIPIAPCQNLVFIGISCEKVG